MTNLPPGVPLRLTLSGGKGLRGLEGLIKRFEIRFRYGQKNTPLNPFDKSFQVLSDPTTILSQEFVLPKPQEEQGKPEK